MLEILRGHFYHGIKPVAQRVDIYLEEGALRLRFQDSSARPDVIWEIGQIIPDQMGNDNRLILSYGKSNDKQHLELLDEDALVVLKMKYPAVKWVIGSRKNSLRSVLVIGISAISILGLLIAGYVYLMPKLADRLASSVPMEWEMELAAKMKPELIKPALIDTGKSELLDSFFSTMNVKTEYGIQLYVLKDSIVNAFAIPGGTIVVYQGLLDRVESYESLAGLLGHEFTHIAKRHSLKSMLRSVSSYILLAMVFGDLTGISGVLLENANSIQNLNYSRTFEREADAEAVRILEERRISLDGMLHLFEVFLKEGSQGIKIPEFLSTHPVTDDRIDFVKKQKAKFQQEPVKYPNLERIFRELKAS